jgi:hypothetical protein
MKSKCLLVAMFMASLLGCSPNVSPQVSELVLNKTVVLKVRTPDGTWVEACVAEGGMLKIKDENTGAHVALSPVITNSKGESSIAILTYHVINSSLGERLVLVDSQLMALHTSVLLTNASFQILIEGISTTSARGSKALDEQVPKLRTALALQAVFGGPPPPKPQLSTISLGQRSAPQEENCCVTCNGMTFCSNCSVLTSCGCCNTALCVGECDRTTPDKSNQNRRNKNKNKNKNANASRNS